MGSSPIAPTTRFIVNNSFLDKAERRLAFRTDELYTPVSFNGKTFDSKSKNSPFESGHRRHRDANSNLFKDRSVKMTHLKLASSLNLYGAIVYGAQATQPRQEWVRFPRNPFNFI